MFHSESRRTGGPDTTVLTIKNQDGNVGIATTSPSTKLHVEHYGSAIGDFEGLNSKSRNKYQVLHLVQRTK